VASGVNTRAAPSHKVSSIGRVARLTDSTPLRAAALVSYATPEAMISPLPALSRNRYLPVVGVDLELARRGNLERFG
jgi:hypothetical protein